VNTWDLDTVPGNGNVPKLDSSVLSIYHRACSGKGSFGDPYDIFVSEIVIVYTCMVTGKDIPLSYHLCRCIASN